MIIDFTGLSIMANGAECEKAAGLFAEEIALRTGAKPTPSSASQTPVIAFALCSSESLPNKDSYLLELNGTQLKITAWGLRGLIFGYSYFLRKTVYENGKITLIKDISGNYSPSMQVRGHHYGYCSMANSYEAWDYAQHSRYFRDMMFFGCNINEQVSFRGLNQKRTRLMKYDADEFLIEASHLADELDLDFSIWYYNDEEEINAAVARRKKVFEQIPRLDAVFPPGGDPGDYPADEFVERCIAISKVLKEVHSYAEMWPSAQQPRQFPNWGEEFMACMEKLPEEIDGVITGPNRAFALDELRRRLPAKYPIRLFSDLGHNVRCEYPVHFNRDDWHYALAAALSRECINPRPTEYRTIHRLTRRYIIGSVSYSEGVNDDINKMVWSDMDFFSDVSLYDTLLDYARVFFYGVSAKKAANGILGLEMNWQGDPAENPHIESTLAIWTGLLAEHPFLIDNWRFVQCLFRAICDALVRRRRCFELDLLAAAKVELHKQNIDKAVEILSTGFNEDYNKLHDDIWSLADKLFHLIGLQLDVKHYCADSWERGATLETIDLPVTDRLWLLNKLKKAGTMPENERNSFIKRVLNRTTVDVDEFYFSLAEHGFEVLGVPQQGEFYIDFQGDRPNVNNGQLPMSMLKLYDHYSFRCKLGGFTAATDYKLRITYSAKKNSAVIHHRIIANGTVIYDGAHYGGERDEKFDAELLAPGFESASYLLPASVFVNGCINLEITEPIAGFMMSEFWIVKKNRVHITH